MDCLPCSYHFSRFALWSAVEGIIIAIGVPAYRASLPDDDVFCIWQRLQAMNEGDPPSNGQMKPASGRPCRPAFWSSLTVLLHRP